MLGCAMIYFSSWLSAAQRVQCCHCNAPTTADRHLSVTRFYSFIAASKFLRVYKHYGDKHLRKEFPIDFVTRYNFAHNSNIVNCKN